MRKLIFNIGVLIVVLALGISLSSASGDWIDLVILVGLFFVFRELWCWFFKSNKILERQNEIRMLLSELLSRSEGKVDEVKKKTGRTRTKQEFIKKLFYSDNQNPSFCA
jgi:hypothetical protein